jgi:hypothetical protein
VESNKTDQPGDVIRPKDVLGRLGMKYCGPLI